MTASRILTTIGKIHRYQHTNGRFHLKGSQTITIIGIMIEMMMKMMMKVMIVTVVRVFFAA